MRISINLATKPFVELRQLFTRLRIAMGVLAVLAIVLGIWQHGFTAQAREQQRQLDEINAQADKLQQERARNEARMKQPQNAAVLERAQFLNDVFAYKSFSWTAVMMDLEQVLPAGVQVTAIEPQISSTGEVSIRLRVFGDREKAVQLMKNLESSKTFVAPRLANEATQLADKSRTQQQPTASAVGGVEFDIVAGYKPLPARPKSGEKGRTAAADDAEAREDSATVPDAAKTTNTSRSRVAAKKKGGAR